METRWQPFHRVLLELISQASGTELEFLATLIKKTKIPAGHDELIEAWNARREAMCFSDDLGVTEDLLEQKRNVAQFCEQVGKHHTSNRPDNMTNLRHDNV